MQAYKSHAPSRESIEMAYDTIIKEKYQDRQKHGFRPPKTGRRADVAARPVSFLRGAEKAQEESLGCVACFFVNGCSPGLLAEQPLRAASHNCRADQEQA